MRKLLIVSDTHGTYRYLQEAVDRFRPHQVIHLGDGFSEAERLAEENFQLPVVKLIGNCDYRDLDPSDYLDELEGVRIYACHGHRYSVKSGLLMLNYAAMERGAVLCFYGHTHIPDIDTSGSITLLNPGACSGGHPTCALVTLDKGSFHCELFEL